jgi:tryptophan-rich sensory protein
MKEIAGATGFGVVVLGTSLTLGLTMKNESKTKEFGSAVFYTVWPVLVILLSVVFGVLLKKLSVTTKSSKRARLIMSLTFVCLMGAMTIIYPTTWVISSTRQRALASLVISMLMLVLTTVTAFLAESVKKGLGAALAPQIAWLVVANNLALNTWRKELEQNEK